MSRSGLSKSVTHTDVHPVGTGRYAVDDDGYLASGVLRDPEDLTVSPDCEGFAITGAGRRGSWHGKRTVLLEFESVEAARNWYRSAGYQGLTSLRHAVADSNAVIVAGFKMPTG